MCLGHLNYFSPGQGPQWVLFQQLLLRSLSPFWAFLLVSSLHLILTIGAKSQNHIDASHSIQLLFMSWRIKSELLSLASKIFSPLVHSIIYLISNYLLRIWYGVGCLLSLGQGN